MSTTSLRAALFLAWLAAGCGPRSTASDTTAPHDEEPAAWIEADTETACARTRSAGAWSQLVYRTTTWRRLAERADGRDPDAWDAIGDRMEHNRLTTRGSACTEDVIRNVRASAARLRGQP